MLFSNNYISSSCSVKKQLNITISCTFSIIVNYICMEILYILIALECIQYRAIHSHLITSYLMDFMHCYFHVLMYVMVVTCAWVIWLIKLFIIMIRLQNTYSFFTSVDLIHHYQIIIVDLGCLFNSVFGHNLTAGFLGWIIIYINSCIHLIKWICKSYHSTRLAKHTLIHY